MTHTDWGECLDTIRSMTGYCFFLGDSITGLLEIQEAANSSKVLIRGRILSLSSATCELQLLLFLLQDLSITFPNSRWSDAIIKVPCTSQPNPFFKRGPSISRLFSCYPWEMYGWINATATFIHHWPNWRPLHQKFTSQAFSEICFQVGIDCSFPTHDTRGDITHILVGYWFNRFICLL